MVCCCTWHHLSAMNIRRHSYCASSLSHFPRTHVCVVRLVQHCMFYISMFFSPFVQYSFLMRSSFLTVSTAYTHTNRQVVVIRVFFLFVVVVVAVVLMQTAISLFIQDNSTPYCSDGTVKKTHTHAKVNTFI